MDSSRIIRFILLCDYRDNNEVDYCVDNFYSQNNEQMYVKYAICESFAAINVQMVERITKLSNTHTVA